MSNVIYLTFDVHASHNNSGIEIVAQIDNNDPQIIAVNQTSQTVSLPVIDDVEANHEFRLIMQGKTNEHTQLDAQGNIVSDVLVYIENLAMDDIALESIIWDLAQYSHDHNGTTNMVVDTGFYGSMGCNGTVSLTFNTPTYLWLLENL